MNKKMRTNLKLFRVKQKLSQEQIADKIGCIRATYSAIENAKRNGRQVFWDDLQKAFGLSFEAVEELKQID